MSRALTYPQLFEPRLALLDRLPQLGIGFEKFQQLGKIEFIERFGLDAPPRGVEIERRGDVERQNIDEFGESLLDSFPLRFHRDKPRFVRGMFPDESAGRKVLFALAHGEKYSSANSSQRVIAMPLNNHFGPGRFQRQKPAPCIVGWSLFPASKADELVTSDARVRCAAPSCSAVARPERFGVCACCHKRFCASCLAYSDGAARCSDCSAGVSAA